jgi:CDP-paratose 2-epimerase
MKVAIVTGSSGLIGSESVRFFARKNFKVVGIDNDMRQYFFGAGASTAWNTKQLQNEIPDFAHVDGDIRDEKLIEKIFRQYGTDIKVIIHTAAQPSHDWAAREPLTDFTINANGTLNLLEAARQHCPDTVFIFTSTNKVYGDTPNRLPMIEHEKRWELDERHPYHAHGIDESMSIDASTHSLFGASKVAADILTQEYGRYFAMKTGTFRGGCLTGPSHSGAVLHGFLAYLMCCAMTKTPYTVFGYKAKQVRDNIHCADLVNMFWHFYKNPRVGEFYNVGGSRFANCSMIEAIEMCEKISGNKIDWSYADENRIGDHIWWVSDVRKFKAHYPAWQYQYDLEKTLIEIHDGISHRISENG